MTDVKSTLPRIAVVGSGYMGGGMAQCFAIAGYTVTLADADAEATLRSYSRLVTEAEAFEKDGLFPVGSAEIVASALSCAGSIEEAVADADYIAEAVPESPAIKEPVLRRISDAAPPTAIIASNTSAIPIAELAAFVTNPERFLGVHWMNPAPFVPGVELIPTPLTSAEVLNTTEAIIDGLGKVAARVPDIAGFVANRLQFALFREALLMVEEGSCTPEQIDVVVSTSFGFRLAFFGPFTAADMAGLDVYAGAFETMTRTYGQRFSAPQLLLDRVAAGDLGLKSGGGFRGIEPGAVGELVAYRNRAYHELAALKARLGAAPGLVHAPGASDESE